MRFVAASLPSRRVIPALLAILATALIFVLSISTYRDRPFQPVRQHDIPDLNQVSVVGQELAHSPIRPPYKDTFGELGRRCRILRDWLLAAEQTSDKVVQTALNAAVEQIALAEFPFLTNSPRHAESHTPIADLRASYIPGTAGIVISCGEKTARFAAHLITTLRNVLNSKLPIRIVYAGDKDLSPKTRERLAGFGTHGYLSPIEFLDITSVFDDSLLQLRTGGWAIKSFAALAVEFEQVIMLDADAVFLQSPEALLSHSAFVSTGALLFHDRLIWPHAFPERHAWWRDQIRHPSAAMNKSRAWTEDYAEEADSGVVVLNKGRIDVLIGLLHVCWQNSLSVREEVTYKLTYGDKESWWLGLELAGATYEFEKHYGAIVGWEENDDQGKDKVCSIYIAHVDEKDQLLWYNGGLLRDKNDKLGTHASYEVPQTWMVDAEWQKSPVRGAPSCMVGGEAHRLTERETQILADSIDWAKKADKIMTIQKDEHQGAAA